MYRWQAGDDYYRTRGRVVSRPQKEDYELESILCAQWWAHNAAANSDAGLQADV